jgi:hypothetical protein
MVLRLLGITEAELTIFSEYISHATVNSMKLLDNPESGWVWGEHALSSEKRSLIISFILDLLFCPCSGLELLENWRS